MKKCGSVDVSKNLCKKIMIVMRFTYEPLARIWMVTMVTLSHAMTLTN